MISRRWLSSKIFVEKVRLLEYWKAQDAILRKEFLRSKQFLMVDRSPLLTKDEHGLLRLACFDISELTHRLADYGVSLDISNSCLLDATLERGIWTPIFGISIITETPPIDAPVNKNDVIKKLGDNLGGKFFDLRSAMFLLATDEHRTLLSRFNSLAKWSHNFRHCPRCASALVTKVSKCDSFCGNCDRTYYPQISPAIITLIKNRENSHLLLVRQRNYNPGVYTLIAGFANAGESLNETVRREVAEEVGLHIDEHETFAYNHSQPWPLPDCSLMVPYISVADMNQTIEKCPAELESAEWYDRNKIQIAYDRTCNSSLKNLSKSVEDRMQLNFIPPKGAIAHRLIGEWLKRMI